MIDHTKSMHAENAELFARVRDLEDKLDHARILIKQIIEDYVISARLAHIAESLLNAIDETLGASPSLNYQDSDKNTNKINEKPVAPKSAERRCEPVNLGMVLKCCANCQHYDAMQRPGKGFCTVDKDHWPTVDATYCCDKFETRGDAA